MNNEVISYSKKIGFLRRGYSSTGGAEAYLKRLAEGLRQQGYRVILLGTGEWPAAEWPGGEVVALPEKSLRDIGASALQIKQEKKMNLLFSFERVPGCDIFRAGDGVHAAWLERQLRTQSWWRRLLIQISPKHREIVRLERELFSHKSQTRIIANSQMVAQEIMNYFKVPSSRIDVIYNGVPISKLVTSAERIALRKKFGVGEKEFVVLFVGSGWKRKGLGIALQAVKDAMEKNPQSAITLWVAGKGNTHQYRSSVVKFLGPIKNLSEIYAAADLFILPTLYDPFSNASLEALAAGLPVITSSANGCSEILKPDVHGTIIDDPCDGKAFAAAVSEWKERLQDPHEAERIRHVCAMRGASLNLEVNIKATMRVIESASYRLDNGH